MHKGDCNLSLCCETSSAKLMAENGFVDGLKQATTDASVS